MGRFIILLTAMVCGMAMAAELQQRLPTLVEIEDADTLRVEVDGSVFRIQLPGIDAPESVPNPKLLRDAGRTGRDTDALLALGRSADKAVREMLPGFMPYQLHFDPEVRDKYGRTPGDLRDGQGRWLSVSLVEAGYAIPRGKTDDQRQILLNQARALAQSQGHGLWGSAAADFSAWAGVSNNKTSR